MSVDARAPQRLGNTLPRRPRVWGCGRGFVFLAVGCFTLWAGGVLAAGPSSSHSFPLLPAALLTSETWPAAAAVDPAGVIATLSDMTTLAEAEDLVRIDTGYYVSGVIATLSDMTTLAEAEDLVRIDTGYYVSLENLDDISVSGYQPSYNFIGDGGGTPVIDPATARIKPQRVDLIHTFLSWKGPYVTYQQGRTDVDNLFGYDRGTPLDPWGSPYFLYSPAGLVKPPLSLTLGDWGDHFSLYAIVSYGPDGLFDGGDDLYYTFGTPPTVLTLTSVTPLVVRAGEVLTLKGYHLDDPAADLFFNGVAANGGILSREPNRLRRRILETDPLGDVEVTLRLPGQTTSPAFTVRIEPRRTRARDWTLY